MFGCNLSLHSRAFGRSIFECILPLLHSEQNNCKVSVKKIVAIQKRGPNILNSSRKESSRTLKMKRQNFRFLSLIGLTYVYLPSVFIFENFNGIIGNVCHLISRYLPVFLSFESIYRTMYYCNSDCSLPCPNGPSDPCTNGGSCELNETCPSSTLSPITSSLLPSLQSHPNGEAVDHSHLSSGLVAGIIILVLGIVGAIIYVLYSRRSDYQRYLAERSTGPKGRFSEQFFSKLNNKDDPWNDEDEDNEVYF